MSLGKGTWYMYKELFVVKWLLKFKLKRRIHLYFFPSKSKKNKDRSYFLIHLGLEKCPKKCPRILQYLSQKNVICPRKKIPEWPQKNMACTVIGKSFWPNGPFSAFFSDLEIFNGPFLIILHRLLWTIFQVNGTMAHGPLPSQSLHVWYSIKLKRLYQNFQ